MTHLNHPSGQQRLMLAASTMHSPRLAVCALTHFHWDSRQYWWLPVCLLWHLCCAIETNIPFNLSCVSISWRQFEKGGRNRTENSLAESYGFNFFSFFFSPVVRFSPLQTVLLTAACDMIMTDLYHSEQSNIYIALCVCIFHHSYLNMIPSVLPCTVPDTVPNTVPDTA